MIIKNNFKMGFNKTSYIASIIIVILNLRKVMEGTGTCDNNENGFIMYRVESTVVNV